MTWEFRLTPDPDSVSEARAHVRETLFAHTDTDTLMSAELVVSELVTNSIRYGPGEPIVLRLAVDADGDVAGEVEDQGHGTVAIREQNLETAIGGMGLPIVDALTSAWGVYPGSTQVWFRFGPLH